jgi:hypothetical protein
MQIGTQQNLCAYTIYTCIPYAIIGFNVNIDFRSSLNHLGDLSDDVENKCHNIENNIEDMINEIDPWILMKIGQDNLRIITSTPFRNVRH